MRYIFFLFIYIKREKKAASEYIKDNFFYYTFMKIIWINLFVKHFFPDTN